MNKRQQLREQCAEMRIAFNQTDTINQLTKKINNHKMSKETKTGIISDEQIDAWKRQYGKVFTIKVKVNENDTAIGYLRPPGRNHKATALSMYAKDKILECGEFLRNNCWLGGDERLKNEDEIADTAAVQASGIVKFLEAELGEI